jgi:hypothetical protein
MIGLSLRPSVRAARETSQIVANLVSNLPTELDPVFRFDRHRIRAMSK